MTAPAQFTVDEAAAATGMSGDQLRAAIRRGDVPAECRGWRYLLSRETVEALQGNRGQNPMNEKSPNVVDGEWPLGRRGLTDDEMHEFRSIYNEQFVALGCKGLEERGFVTTMTPCTFSFDCPVADEGQAGRRCIVTVMSSDVEWQPGNTLPLIPADADLAGVACVYAEGAQA